MNWKLWLKGLTSAAIGGAMTAASTVAVAPDQFNMSSAGTKNILTVAGVSALVAVANYLKSSPLPK